MTEINASFLSPLEKRAAVDRGDTIFYPWAGNQNSLVRNAADIMGPSSTMYTTRLDLAPGWEREPDLVHKAWIIPVTKRQDMPPFVPELIVLPDQA